MRPLHTFVGLAAAAISVVALVGPATAQAAAGTGNTAANLCGGGVFLDGIRALEVSENGRDEVKIVNGTGKKIWPVTAPYVSIARDQRVEVDKCVKVGSLQRLIEVDDLDANDNLGSIRIRGHVTRNYEFHSGESRYRIGVIR
ncbi:hypothetical protein ABGB08_33785 [Acrocarpospora sp. B8E8]